MRVLVMPASKHGGTAEIGRAIATALRAEGIDVDVSQPEHMLNPSIYDGFVLGSAIYLGKWLERAAEFVDEYRDVIRRKPTWLFSSGPLGDSKPDEPIRQDVIDDLMTLTGAREHRLFSGRIRFDDLGRSERFVARWVGVEEGDYREWDLIKSWTAQIAAELLAEAPTPTEP